MLFLPATILNYKHEYRHTGWHSEMKAASRGTVERRGQIEKWEWRSPWHGTLTNKAEEERKRVEGRKKKTLKGHSIQNQIVTIKQKLSSKHQTLIVAIFAGYKHYITSFLCTVDLFFFFGPGD